MTFPPGDYDQVYVATRNPLHELIRQGTGKASSGTFSCGNFDRKRHPSVGSTYKVAANANKRRHEHLLECFAFEHQTGKFK